MFSERPVHASATRDRYRARGFQGARSSGGSGRFLHRPLTLYEGSRRQVERSSQRGHQNAALRRAGISADARDIVWRSPLDFSAQSSSTYAVNAGAPGVLGQNHPAALRATSAFSRNGAALEISSLVTVDAIRREHQSFAGEAVRKLVFSANARFESSRAVQHFFAALEGSARASLALRKIMLLHVDAFHQDEFDTLVDCVANAEFPHLRSVTLQAVESCTRIPALLHVFAVKAPLLDNVVLNLEGDSAIGAATVAGSLGTAALPLSHALAFLINGGLRRALINAPLPLGEVIAATLLNRAHRSFLYLLDGLQLSRHVSAAPDACIKIADESLPMSNIQYLAGGALTEEDSYAQMRESGSVLEAVAKRDAGNFVIVLMALDALGVPSLERYTDLMNQEIRGEQAAATAREVEESAARELLGSFSYAATESALCSPKREDFAVIDLSSENSSVESDGVPRTMRINQQVEKQILLRRAVLQHFFHGTEVVLTWTQRQADWYFLYEALDLILVLRRLRGFTPVIKVWVPSPVQHYGVHSLEAALRKCLPHPTAFGGCFVFAEPLRRVGNLLAVRLLTAREVGSTHVSYNTRAALSSSFKGEEQKLQDTRSVWKANFLGAAPTNHSRDTSAGTVQETAELHFQREVWVHCRRVELFAPVDGVLGGSPEDYLPGTWVEVEIEAAAASFNSSALPKRTVPGIVQKAPDGCVDDLVRVTCFAGTATMAATAPPAAAVGPTSPPPSAAPFPAQTTPSQLWPQPGDYSLTAQRVHVRPLAFAHPPAAWSLECVVAASVAVARNWDGSRQHPPPQSAAAARVRGIVARALAPSVSVPNALRQELTALRRGAWARVSLPGEFDGKPLPRSPPTAGIALSELLRDLSANAALRRKERAGALAVCDEDALGAGVQRGFRNPSFLDDLTRDELESILAEVAARRPTAAAMSLSAAVSAKRGRRLTCGLPKFFGLDAADARMCGAQVRPVSTGVPENIELVQTGLFDREDGRRLGENPLQDFFATCWRWHPREAFGGLGAASRNNLPVDFFGPVDFFKFSGSGVAEDGKGLGPRSRPPASGVQTPVIPLTPPALPGEPQQTGGEFPPSPRGGGGGAEEIHANVGDATAAGDAGAARRTTAAASHLAGTDAKQRLPPPPLRHRTPAAAKLFIERPVVVAPRRAEAEAATARPDGAAGSLRGFVRELPLPAPWVSLAEAQRPSEPQASPGADRPESEEASAAEWSQSDGSRRRSTPPSGCRSGAERRRPATHSIDARRVSRRVRVTSRGATKVSATKASAAAPPPSPSRGASDSDSTASWPGDQSGPETPSSTQEPQVRSPSSASPADPVVSRLDAHSVVSDTATEGEVAVDNDESEDHARSPAITHVALRKRGRRKAIRRKRPFSKARKSPGPMEYREISLPGATEARDSLRESESEPDKPPPLDSRQHPRASEVAFLSSFLAFFESGGGTAGATRIERLFRPIESTRPFPGSAMTLTQLVERDAQLEAHEEVTIGADGGSEIGDTFTRLREKPALREVRLLKAYGVRNPARMNNAVNLRQKRSSPASPRFELPVPTKRPRKNCRVAALLHAGALPFEELEMREVQTLQRLEYLEFLAGRRLRDIYRVDVANDIEIPGRSTTSRNFSQRLWFSQYEKMQRPPQTQLAQFLFCRSISTILHNQEQPELGNANPPLNFASGSPLKGWSRSLSQGESSSRNLPDQTTAEREVQRHTDDALARRALQVAGCKPTVSACEADTVDLSGGSPESAFLKLAKVVADVKHHRLEQFGTFACSTRARLWRTFGMRLNNASQTT